MDYLIVKLAWYLGAAFVLGLIVGWTASRPKKTQARVTAGAAPK